MAGREITRPIVVVCEGASDCSLINALVRQHSLLRIQALCPNDPQGFDAISNFLLGLSQTPGWRAMRGFLLVVDANGAITNRLAQVATILAPYNLQVADPFVVERTSSPARAVYLRPGPSRTGCFEDLLLDAIHERDASLIPCIDSFASCTQLSQSWTTNLQAKMKVHSLVAACCEDDPASALSYVWKYTSNPIPIGSSHFAGILDMLRQFEAIS